MAAAGVHGPYHCGEWLGRAHVRAVYRRRLLSTIVGYVDGHIVIAGPGRAGTTLLVKLLARLNFETGGRLRPFSEAAQAGLEDDLLDADAPYVVKNPDLSWQLGGLLESGRIAPDEIEWLIVPMRDLREAAASRVRTTTAARDVHAPGGLIGTVRPAKQQQQLAEVTYRLFHTAARFDLPLIVMEYPRFALDSAYAYRRLRPLLNDRTEADFTAAWKAVVDPALVRTLPIKIHRFAGTTLAGLRVRRAISRLARYHRRRT